MKLKAITLIVVALVMAAATPVYASDVPPLPHAFYGDLTINDNPAPAGTTVEARGEGVRMDISGNPIVTTEAGKYGSVDPLGSKLVVQGDIADGETLTFYVNDEPTGQTAEWHSGEVTELDLSVTITVPGPPGPTYYYIQTNLFGIEARYRIKSDGELLQTIEATSADGNLTITIPEGTVALDIESERLETLEVAVDETLPDPPEDAYIIELAYDFTPDGATFDLPITFIWSYDPDLPEDVAEEDLVVAYYDEEAGNWVEVDFVVDTENDTITGSVSHFTTFAIIGSVTPPTPPEPAAFSVSSLSVLPAEVEPGETVTIAVSVANTGGESGSYTVVLKIDGVKESEERVTIAAGSSRTVSFSVTREEADTYTVAVDGLSGSFTVVAPVVVVPPEPAAFSVSSLSVLPAEVEANETVTITVSIANTGGKSGSYTVVLKIEGVKEDEETVTVAAGESQEVSFSVTREEADTYTVTVDGLSDSFTVTPPEEEEEEVPIEPPGVNWPLIGGIIAAVVIVAGLLYYFLVFRRRAY